MVLRLDVRLYSKLGNKNCDAGHIKRSREPKVPPPLVYFSREQQVPPPLVYTFSAMLSSLWI